MSVNSEKAFAVAAGIVAVLMLMDAWVYVSHWYRIWNKDRVYCSPVDKADELLEQFLTVNLELADKERLISP